MYNGELGEPITGKSISMFNAPLRMVA